MDAIFARKNVRDFQEKAIEPRKVKKLMKAAMAAPSAEDQQPWEFYLVTDRGLCEKLSTCSRFAGPAEKAPLCIVPCYASRTHHKDYVIQEMAASCENILLEATHLNLGAIWFGIAPKEGRMELVRNALNIPKHLKPFAIIAVGYPAEEVGKQLDSYDASKLHFYTLPEERFE